MRLILKISISAIILTGFSVSLLGCSTTTRVPGIYRMDIRQGNYICEETVSRLRVGMTKAQIQELFGSPAITHVLNKDRWDYYYSFEPGTDRGADNIERRISIYFRNDIVVRWE